MFELWLGGMAVLAPRARYSEWKVRHKRLEAAKVAGLPEFPDSRRDRLRDMVHDEAKVARRAEELRDWLEATVNLGGDRVEYHSATHGRWVEAKVLQEEADGTVSLDVRGHADKANIRRGDAMLEFDADFCSIMGFNQQTLAEKYGTTAAALQGDPALLRRALAFLRATGEVLYYEDVPALCDTVFIRPQWLVDVMKELVRHDLPDIVADMGDSLSVGSTEADMRRLQDGANHFPAGIATERVMQWLWRRTGILPPDSAVNLVEQLIELLCQLSIVLEWQPAADGSRQWLMPLRLPSARPELPPIWSAEAPSASEVGRRYEFGSDVPPGLVAVLLHSVATIISDPVSITAKWRSGIVAALTGKHSDLAVTADQSSVQFESRSSKIGSHQALLKTMRRFEDEMRRIL